MKKILYFGLGIALLVLAVFLYASNRAPEGGKTVTFFCEKGSSITATFYPENDTHVDLTLSDGRSLSVPHAISASGARYANADESFVFWNKGETAFITEGAITTYENCSIKQ